MERQLRLDICRYKAAEKEAQLRGDKVTERKARAALSAARDALLTIWEAQYPRFRINEKRPIGVGADKPFATFKLIIKSKLPLFEENCNGRCS